MQRCALRCTPRRPRYISSNSGGITTGCAHKSASRRCSSRTSASEPPASSSAQSSSVSCGSSALQQQLGFCCLMCGWETACTSCPFDWYGFDPRKVRDRHYHGRRRGAADIAGFGSQQELQDALATLGLAGRVDAQEVKAAFRTKALEWHPDCSAHENAEDMFKEIVRAYELLLAAFPSSD